MVSNNSIPAEFSASLEAIADQLRKLKTKYPTEFNHVCNEAVCTGEMSLGDAESAFDWATNYLLEGGR